MPIRGRARLTVDPTQRSVPALTARVLPARCVEDPACCFPVVAQGRCRQHLRDSIADRSGVGTCALLLDYVAPVEEHGRTPRPDPAYRRRYRTNEINE